MSSRGKRLTQYDVVARKLGEVVKALQPGEKLPSIRQLMKEFGVSQATVDRGLTILADKGLVERVAGRGLFASQPRAVRKNHHIDVCFFLPHETFQNPLFTEMTAQMLSLAHAKSLELNVIAHDGMGCVDAFRQRIERSSPGAVILWCTTNIAFELVLRRMNIPYVSMSPNARDEHSTCLITDSKKGIEATLDHLVALGHRRIAMFHGQGYRGFYDSDQDERIETFYAGMRKRGLLIPSNFVRYGGWTFEDGYHAATSLLSGKIAPTAILCNDYNAEGIIQAANAKGLNVPNDVSVVGFDNIPIARKLSPPLTTVSIGQAGMVSLALEMAAQGLSGEALVGRVVRTPVELIIRASTAKCSKAATQGASVLPAGETGGHTSSIQ